MAYSCCSSNLLASVSGILALGFGDTAASIVGKRYGRWHWPGSKKTVEGTMAFVVTMYASAVLIMYGSAFLGIHSATHFIVSMTSADWAAFLITASLTGNTSPHTFAISTYGWLIME